MPLRDHFRPPLSIARHWESFHAAWATEIMRTLNRRVLPAGYFAETQVHLGGRVEVDVGTFEEEGQAASGKTGNGAIATQAWAPPATTLMVPAVFPDEFEVQVFRDSGGSTLVAAVELVSPGNKDRPEARRAFAAKCAGYLQQGVGLVIVDVVTERRANLHDEWVRLLDQEDRFCFPAETTLYAAAYRPARRDPGGDQIDLWLEVLTVGQALPVMPLALSGGPTLPLDLDGTYTEVCRDSRL